MSALHLFVYGTLKRGGSNHARFCEGVARVVPASIWGRLHVLADTYPILVVPSSAVLAHGSACYADDVARLAEAGAEAVAPRAMGEGWRRVRGELLTFEGAQAAARLPRFDALEDYEPAGALSSGDAPARGLRESRLGYERVMVTVQPDAPDLPLLRAWTYVCPQPLQARCPPLDADVWDEATWRKMRE